MALASENAAHSPRVSGKLTAVVFDAGETLVDEARDWEAAFDRLGVELPSAPFTAAEFYPDAPPCLRALRTRGLVVASSERRGVEKPSPTFSERVAAAAARPTREIAYVGERVDNDVHPALAVGMVAVHVRRGSWGHLQTPPEGALRVGSPAEVPEALAGV